LRPQGMPDPGDLTGLTQGVTEVLGDIAAEMKREWPAHREGDQDGPDNHQHDLARAWVSASGQLPQVVEHDLAPHLATQWQPPHRALARVLQGRA
jgi:hypothetical protein